MGSWRDARVEVRLTITTPSLKDGHIESAMLVIDGREGPPFDLVADASGQALSRFVRLDRRGPTRSVPVVRTKNSEHAPARPKVSVRYQAAPRHRRGRPGGPRKSLGAVADVRDKFGLRAHVPESARFGLVEIDGKKIPKLPEGNLNEKLELREGERTIIRLEALPRDARAEDEQYEKSERTLVVLFQKKDSPRPLFTEVELDSGTARARRVAVEQGKPTIVDARASAAGNRRRTGEVDPRRAAERPRRTPRRGG
jgi:hypothetical protein